MISTLLGWSWWLAPHSACNNELIVPNHTISGADQGNPLLNTGPHISRRNHTKDWPTFQGEIFHKDMKSECLVTL